MRVGVSLCGGFIPALWISVSASALLMCTFYSAGCGGGGPSPYVHVLFPLKGFAVADTSPYVELLFLYPM